MAADEIIRNGDVDPEAVRQARLSNPVLREEKLDTLARELDQADLLAVAVEADASILRVAGDHTVLYDHLTVGVFQAGSVAGDMAPIHKPFDHRAEVQHRQAGDDVVLAIYGPFNYGGRYTSESNARFDIWLKSRDPDSGIRNFEDLDILAQRAGMLLRHDYEMPANNRILYWEKSRAD